jgi:uncharacterized protein (UPF0548 family)
MRAARDFEYACKFGDPNKLLVVAGLLDETNDGWRLAMKRVAALGSVSNDIQKAFVNIWTQHKHLPLRVGHRPTMARALHVLLPKMKRIRKPIRLYRGAQPHERRSRLYGFSWTSDREIAERFAQGRRNPDGAVVLETLANPDAVLHVRQNIEGYYEEAEHIIDPYKLTDVKVVTWLRPT